MPVDIKVLESQFLFKNLPAQELEILSGLIFERNYSIGSTLFVEGMEGEVLYIIKQGSVQLTKKNAENQEFVLAKLNAGDFLGEMTFVDNRPRTATARIAENSVLLVMTKKAFVTIKEKHPNLMISLLMKFLMVANERLRKANEAIKQV
jgi:CRP/FNR family transcriptional regulator